MLKELGAFGLHHSVIAEPVPELKTNFEEFVFVDVAELDHVLQTLLNRAAHYFNIWIRLHCVGNLLNQGDVVFQHCRNSERYLSREVFEGRLLFRVFHIDVLLLESSALYGF